MISVVIPAYNEEKYIGATLQSLLESMKECPEEIEIIVVNNNSTDNTCKVALGYDGVKCFYYPILGRELAKNFGAEKAFGETLCFVDADCLVSVDFFAEISEKAQNPYFIGGGMKYVKMTRYSLGLFIGLVPIALTMFLNQITIGAFWARKDVFDAIKGFRTTTFDDIDFAIRMKKYAKKHQKKFESLKKSYLIWSTRKADIFGDWFWLYKYKKVKDASV